MCEEVLCSNVSIESRRRIPEEGSVISLSLSSLLGFLSGKLVGNAKLSR